MQEVDHVVDALGLEPGDRVLDVGCGPGRHAHELARRGIVVHGIDISQRFVELADGGRAAGGDVRAPRCPGAAVRRRVRRRDLPVPGSVRADDRRRRRTRRCSPGIAAALQARRRACALSAFNAYFAVKYHEAATFDADTGRQPRAHRGAQRARRGDRGRSVDGVLHAARAAAAVRRAGLGCDRRSRSASSRARTRRMHPIDRDHLNSWCIARRR